MANCLSLYTLPNEVLYNIVQNLSYQNHLKLRKVDKTLRAIVDDTMRKLVLIPAIPSGMSNYEYHRSAQTFSGVRDVKLICKKTPFHIDLKSIVTPFIENLLAFSVRYDLQTAKKSSKKNTLITKCYEDIFRDISKKEKIQKLKIVVKEKLSDEQSLYNLIFCKSIKHLELANAANTETIERIDLLIDLNQLKLKKIKGFCAVNLLMRRQFLELQQLCFKNITLEINLVRSLGRIALNIPNLKKLIFEGGCVDIAHFTPLVNSCNKLESLTIESIQNPIAETFRVFVESVKDLRFLKITSADVLDIDEQCLLSLKKCKKLEFLQIGTKINYHIQKHPYTIILKDVPRITENIFAQFLKTYHKKLKPKTLVLDNTGINFKILSSQAGLSDVSNLIIKNSLPLLDQHVISKFQFIEKLNVLSLDVFDFADEDMLGLAQVAVHLSRLRIHSSNDLTLSNQSVESLLKYCRNLISLEFNRDSGIDVDVFKIISLYGLQLRFFKASWTKNLVNKDHRLKNFSESNKVLRLLGTPNNFTYETEMNLRKFFSDKNLLFKINGEKTFSKVSSLTVDIDELKNEELKIFDALNLAKKKVNE